MNCRIVLLGCFAGTVISALACSANADVESMMATPGGSSATVTITLTITTSLGTSNDTDARTMATTGTAIGAFVPDAAPFSGAQFNAMQLSFANANYAFQFFCFPPFGCAVNLGVSIMDLQMELVEPTCVQIGAGGAVSYPTAMVRLTGSYSTSGFAVSSGVFDNIGTGAISGRITNPAAGTVLLDQVTLAQQTIIVDPASLPEGVTALTIVIQPNLSNTTMSGVFAPAVDSSDADNDGLLDGCDTCVDTDGDGFGDPEYPNNLCAVDNCPSEFNPDQTDTDNNGIGDACDVPLCIGDIAPPGGDGGVGVPDLLAIINAWGPCSGCAADIAPPGGDDAVGVPDLLAIINSWGTCP